VSWSDEGSWYRQQAVDFIGCSHGGTLQQYLVALAGGGNFQWHLMRRHLVAATTYSGVSQQRLVVAAYGGGSQQQLAAEAAQCAI